MFYYAATFNYDNETQNMIVSCANELKKGNIAIIEDSPEFIAVKIMKSVSVAEALTSRYKPVEVIGYVDVAPYLKQKEKEGQKAILMSQMETKMKEIKSLEQYSKYIGKDPELKAMYEALIDSSEPPEETTEPLE